MRDSKLFLSAGFLFFSMTVFSQVGINNTAPKATLDITAKNETGISQNVEGLLIPRVDRQKAQSMTGIPTSTLIYVNSTATGTAAGTAVNIDTAGYYYYNGSVWAKLMPPSAGSVNIYNSNGNLEGDRLVAQGDKTLAFTGTKTNAFSVDGATLSVDAANHRLGIKNNEPSVDVEIGSSSLTTGTPNPTLRIHSNANEAGKGGIIEFTEQGPAYGTLIKHHTAASADGSLSEGLHFVSRSNDIESITPTLSLDQVRERVGVGTGSPQKKLHVNGSMQLTNEFNVGGSGIAAGSAGTAGQVLTSAGAGAAPTWTAVPANTNLYNADGSLTTDRTVAQGDHTLAFTGNAVNALSVDGATFSVDALNDKVGMGTVSPQTKLDIVTGDGAYGFQHSNGTVKLRSYIGSNAGSLGTQSNHPVNVMTNNTTQMRIETNGNVGIGSTAPAAKLHVEGSELLNAAVTGGSTKNALDINIGQDGYSYGNRSDNYGINMRTSSSVHAGNIARINFGDTSASSNNGARYLSFSVGKTLNEVMYINENNVGINNSSPNATLEVSSVPGNTARVDGIIPPRLKGSEVKAKDLIYGTNQTGAIIYVTEGLAAAATSTKTQNITDKGYYYFNGSIWLRFNDVGVAPLTKVAFNGAGAYFLNDVVHETDLKRISFPNVIIAIDPTIGTWDAGTSEMKVARKGVFTVTASLNYENVSTTSLAYLTVRAGNETEGINSLFASPITPGTVGPLSQRNNISVSFVLNPGDKIWIEGHRDVPSLSGENWVVGKRSLNITFSEIN